MATVTKTTEKRKVCIEKDEPVYTLKLSKEEAAALYRVTDFVGGVPYGGSPRGLIDDIRGAMRQAGAPMGEELKVAREQGGIYFNKYNED